MVSWDSLVVAFLNSSKIILLSQPGKHYRLLVNGVALTTRFKHPGFPRYPDKSMPLGRYIEVLQKLINLGKTVVITTNYALISDKAVQWINDRRLGLPQGIGPPKDLRRFQYGFKVSAVWTSDIQQGTNFDEEYFRNPLWLENKELVQIYKLHGGSNWVYCDNCSDQRELHLSRTFNDVKKIFSIKENPTCCKCGTSYEYSIVPPMTNKNIDSDLVLKTVWSKAREALLNSTHIIFIGYSLPNADPKVIDLIKSTRSLNRKYYLIMEKNHEVISRYERLLGENLVKTFNSGYSSSNLFQIYEQINAETT